jgi:putative ABC transport system permease protein
LNAPVVTRVAEAPATPATRAKVLPPLDTPPGRMGTLEALRGALSALAANKLRAMLTALGIFIGVAAVIATVAVGAGARQQVLAQIQSLGANVIVIWGGSVNVGGVRLGAGQRQNLTWDDARAIERGPPRWRPASGHIRSQQQVVAGNQNWATPCQGSGPGQLRVHDCRPSAAGSSPPRKASRRPQGRGALPGAENLFGEADPVGQEIRIRTTPSSDRRRRPQVAERAGDRTSTTRSSSLLIRSPRSIMGNSRVWSLGQLDRGEGA